MIASLRAMPLHAAALLRAALLALFIAVWCGSALGQTPITRPVRIIVPYVQGGGSDALSRMLAPYLSEAFGQQVLVENRAGASSTIGTQLVARAAPDGHTIGMIDAAFTTNPGLFAKLPYDTLKDFVPVVFVARSPLALIVHPSVPATTVKELVALAKAKPGQLTAGSAGNGTGVHLAFEQLRIAAAIDVTHIPYKGAGQAVTELLGGQITMMFTTPLNAQPHSAAGKARALAVTSANRTPAMPDLVTFTEAGYPSVDAVTINGFIVPAGTPEDYVRRVNATVQRALKTPELQDRLQKLGFEIVGGSPEAFGDFIRREIAKWTRIIKDAGIQVAQ
jgi:tripartite-type tricarboxylate transporter receptor subunit TctC